MGSNKRMEMMLPASAEFWIRPDSRFEVGLVVRVDGNQYHGDPTIYGVRNPQLRYSVGTVGPSFAAALRPNIRFTIDSGFTVLRRFEFFDGDTEAASLDLKKSGFLRLGIKLGQ